MFLNLAAAFQLLLAETLTEDDRIEGQRLLTEHLHQFCKVIVFCAVPQH